MKFYHALNCNRRIGSQGRLFDFRPYALVCGTWCGLYVTQDLSEQTALDLLTLDPRQAITSISREEFEDKLGSQSRDASANYSPLLTRPVSSAPEPLVAGSRAIVIEQPNSEPAKPPHNERPATQGSRCAPGRPGPSPKVRHADWPQYLG